MNKKIIYIFTETARACFQQPIYKQGKSNFKVDYHSRNTATSAKKPTANDSATDEHQLIN